MSKRKHLKRILDSMRRHSSQFGYAEIRPMRLTQLTEDIFLFKLDKGDRFISDCSETITAAFKWAGFRDPNGLDYNNYGNSETMLGHLRHFFHSRFANVGTIVHFTDPDHVAVVYKPDRFRGNPLICEHGGPGIVMLKVSEEAEFHHGPITYLSIAKL
jgi:hypothetical protein